MYCELTSVSSGTFKMQQSPAICNYSQGCRALFRTKIPGSSKGGWGDVHRKKEQPITGTWALALWKSELTRSNQPHGKRKAHWSSCISFSGMLEIVGVICFKREAWLLIIGQGGGGWVNSRFRAEVRNSLEKSSSHSGNMSQILVWKQEDHTTSISIKGCRSSLENS